jgi:hypothetical protein
MTDCVEKKWLARVRGWCAGEGARRPGRRPGRRPLIDPTATPQTLASHDGRRLRRSCRESRPCRAAR